MNERGLRLSAALLLVGACCLSGASGTPARGASAVGPPGGEAAKPPDDPLFKHQWHLRAIQIPAAWRVSRGKGAVVAVLDTGVAYENRGIHRRAPDLAGTRFVPGWDFVDGDAHPNDEPPLDRQSHGTLIAGIIAQTTGNAIGAAGVAPEASIMPVRVLKRDVTGSARTIARGLRFAADHGADVANLSIAGHSGEKVLEQAVAYAASKGVTVVASAGNGGRAPVSFPAAYPDVIAVGAVRRDRSRAYYSSYGKALDLVAPGGEREVVDGEGGATGDGVLQQTLKGGPSTFCYCFMASTSAAAAQVSGAAALLVASGRATRPAQVRAALTSGARDLGRRGPDAEHGAGLLQISAALQSASDEPAADRDGGSRWGRPWVVWLVLGLVGAAALTGALARRSRGGGA